jgi:uncharacterized Zn finger protein
MWYRDDYSRFRRSKARQAKGGIKAQSKRGSFAASWWAKRWIEVLESFDIGARLGRGRSYARRGQVLSVDVTKGKVQATVQGSRPKPYDITIGVKILTPADWKKLAAALTAQAIFAGKLLAGEMPQDIETIFREVGLSLFPEKLGDLATECSCPDWSNPCKHIAAVYYLLGEEFDRDPFLLFKLRGKSREELLPLLGESEGAPAGQKTRKPGARAKPTAPRPVEPLTTDPTAFWSIGSLPEDLFGEVQTPPVSAALPKRLGNFPFWRGEERFLDALEPVYRRAAQRGLDTFVGQSSRDSA